MRKFIHQLIFIKIVLQAVKRLRKIVIKKEIEKDCEEIEKDQKRLFITKDCKKASCYQ